MTKIIISSDHRGFNLKKNIMSNMQLDFIDCGAYSIDRCDYTFFTKELVRNIDDTNFGILICGSGIGVSIMANKFKNIRAALCYNRQTIIDARQHSNANILCLGADFVKLEDAIEWINIFITTDFLKQRPYIARINELNSHGE